MEDSRFDRLTRTLSGVNTRRGTVASLLGGLALSLASALPTDAKNRRGRAVHAEKRKHKKKCPTGLLTCTIKQGKKKKRFCVDGQNDPLNCGGCGNLCAAAQACQGGACTCNGTVCAGCCDGSTCQTGTSNQRCGANGAVCQGCTSPSTCGGGGTAGMCGCTKTTCAAQAKNCGMIPDGCNGNLNCGTCDGGESEKETCGGGGVPNVCGCVPEGSVTTHRDFCCTSSCCRDELPEGQCRCAGGCG